MEKTRILVWDLPVRLFHWLLVVSFAGAFLTAESERVRIFTWRSAGRSPRCSRSG